MSGTPTPGFEPLGPVERLKWRAVGFVSGLPVAAVAEGVV